MGSEDKKSKRQSHLSVVETPASYATFQDEVTPHETIRGLNLPAIANVTAKSVVGAVFDAMANRISPEAKQEDIKMASEIRKRWQAECGGVSFSQMTSVQRKSLLKIIADTGFSSFIRLTDSDRIDERFYAQFLSGMVGIALAAGFSSPELLTFKAYMQENRQANGASTGR